MKTWTVYQHIFPNCRSYIGITSKQNPYDRFGKNGREYGYYVGRAIKKYGWENVKHIILETGLTQKEANEREKYYIQLYNTQAPNGYNITSGGEGRAGYKHIMSEQTKQKISKTKTGVKMGPRNDLWKQHISESKLNSHYRHSEETKQKIKNNRKNVKVSDETKSKIRATVLEKKLYMYLLTPEVKQKTKLARSIVIEQIDDLGNIIKVFNSATECAKYFNCSVALISCILSGKKQNKYNIRRKI